MPDTALQDYLKAVYKLQETAGSEPGPAGEPVSTSALSERLGVSQASVTGMLKKLARKDFVSHEPYRGVRLTEAGRRVAVATIRRHRIVEQFLVEALGFTWDEVDEEAEILEHAVSEKVVNRMWEVLGRPRSDPHGSPIPSSEGVIEPESDARPLTETPVETPVRVTRIRNRSPDELRYLGGLGLELGAELVLEEKAPFDGPLLIRVGGRRHALDPRFAHAVLVE